jgi:hypothetical protein
MTGRISGIATMALALFIAGAASVQPLRAQEVRVGAGVAIPTGSLNTLGPAALISLGTPATSAFGLRLDLTIETQGHATDAPGGPQSRGTLRSVGASLNGLLRLGSGETRPYLIGGLGGYRLRAQERADNPNGTTWGGNLGAGIDMRWGGVSPFVEGRALVHVSDFGSYELSPTLYFPIIAGLMFRLGQ